MRWLLVAGAIALSAGTAQAATQPVVVELFTSEACSSCPPAEAVLKQLKATDAAILPLSFHVTYWNSAAWTDAYGLQAATDRQSYYAALHGSSDVYTPEAVVDGTAQMVGSDQTAVTRAIAAARLSALPVVPVTITGASMIAITVGGGAVAAANIWLFGYDSAHRTKIGGGENGGATIDEVNVVRSVTALGPWDGRLRVWSVARPVGEHVAVLVQMADGRIAGAASD